MPKGSDFKGVKEALQQKKALAKAQASYIANNHVDSPIIDDDDIKFNATNINKFGIGKDKTDEQENNRVRYIEGMMLGAYRPNEIMYNIMQRFEITKVQAEKYLALGREALNDSWREYYEDEINWHVALRKRIIMKNMKKETGDDKMALSALDSLARVQSIYDYKPAIEANDTEFDAGDAGLDDYKDLIKEVEGGNKNALEQAKKDYYKNDARRIAIEQEMNLASDEDDEDSDE